jgi:hypothetical protein
MAGGLHGSFHSVLGAGWQATRNSFLIGGLLGGLQE